MAGLVSAQATDKRVNICTKELMKKASNRKEMLRRGEIGDYECIKTCGLATKKVKANIVTSKVHIEEHRGKVPKEIELLECLPGVGHKTASVVVSEFYKKPAFPVDTHIHRLSQRLGLTNGKSVKQTEKDLKDVFDEMNWRNLHLQIIFYGRSFCTARGCDGTVCFMCKSLYPNRQTKKKTSKAYFNFFGEYNCN